MISLLRLLLSFRKNSRGSTVLIFTLAFPALALTSAGVVQYTSLVQQRHLVQQAADSAAVGGATELNLANSNTAIVSSVLSMAHASLGSTDNGEVDSVAAQVIDSGSGVAVQITRTVPAFFKNLVGSNSTFQVSGQAVAHATGSRTPICVIGLNGSRKGTISLDTNAVVQATGCAVYSDSSHPWSISSVDNAVLKTALTCAVGGKQGNFPNFAPQPKSGCPTVADPLASRSAPPVPACDHTNLVVSASTALSAGVYCGGLTVTGAVTATLAPGIYIMQGGPLKVTSGGTLNGVNVGVYLTGTGAVLDFEANSTISLTAPKTGTMTGLLFFEDRANTSGALHQILSNNAQTLLGTIYLPVGRFFVGANAPVAGNSAYTIVVANTVELSAGPTLVLNASYGSSDIPVPDGLGPHSGSVRLTQ